MKILVKFGYACIFISIIFTLTSCDCLQRVSGVVVDYQTNKPLDSVFVLNIQNSFHSSITDSMGNFHIENITGGLNNCSKMELKITRNGYKELNIVVKNESNNFIRLKRNEH